LSGQSVSRALTRLADLTAEAVGSAHGGVAAAVRGALALGRDRTVIVVGRDGSSATMRLHEARFSGMDTIGSQLLSGSYEPTTARVLEALVTPGSTVVDVGANIGYFTVLSALLTGPTGRVIAFEPEPRNHAVLTDNVASNGLRQVTVVQAACADRVGTHELAINASETGWHRLVPVGEVGRGKRVIVEVTTVDTIIGEAPVDVVKIDVEGHEGSVVAGMAQTLADNPGITVILEHSPAQARLAGVDPIAPVTMLQKAGLRHTYVVREDKAVLERIDAEALRSREVRTGRSVNLVMRAQPWPADSAVPVVS
jgi:FkbM family methyltransferase